jgi:uncharacterized protein (DUF58 family)
MTLLDPATLRALDALSRSVRRGAAAARFGPDASKAIGGTIEFADRRPYAIGDDTRGIDWLAYARSGTPIVRRFHEEQASVVRVLLDCSASSTLGRPSKFGALQRMAAAIGYLWLGSGARVQLVTTQHAGVGSDRERSLSFHDELRGRRSAAGLFEAISHAAPAGTTDVAAWLQRLTANKRSRASIVLVSDLLDPKPFVRSLAVASERAYSLTLVQVLSADELHPPVGGDATLHCVETNEQLRITADAETLARYEHHLKEWFHSLSDWARRSGNSYVRLASGDDILGAVRRLARGAVEPS